MINEEKVIISNGINIGATIAYRDKNEKRPLVLLIMGTGTTDRDGNSFGFKTNLYKNLSDMFVEMGYVCIRYDKRGTHESTGDYKTGGLSDLVSDAANIIHYAKKLDYIDEEKIVVCGHSEGAMIATLLTRTEELRGIILLGGACMGLKEALQYQNYLVFDQVQDMKGILGWYLRKVLTKDRIEKQVTDLFNRASKSNKPRFFYNGGFFNTKYMQEHASLSDEEYISILKEYKGKVLAITGMADIQADYRKLDSVSSIDDITIYTPEKVNHVMREIDGEPDIINVKKEYKKVLKKDIHQGVKDTIKKWTSQL
ncbi:MAG: alpha/beta hydrolase [Bacilli bacterium]|nr:alpha/beta hydrolase [Bacilli bacterium]